MAVLINLIFYSSILIYNSGAYKALVVTQMPSKSHAILNNGIVRQLLKDGNEVTYIRCREYTNAPHTLRQIDVSSNAEALPSLGINIKALMDAGNGGNNHDFVFHIMTNIGIKTLENSGVQKLINDPTEHFDVVIIEFMDTDILASFAAVFDCPLIWLSPVEVNSDILMRIDSMPNPAYVVNSLSPNVNPLTFEQRIKELWARIKVQYLHYMYYNDVQVEAYKRLVVPSILKRGRVPPSFHEVRYNVSFVLGYSHASIGEAVPLPQNYKSVGGYHVDENIKPLPKELQIIMDNAKNGVIFFSMGSNLKSSDWPEEVKQNLLKMLGEMKQTVFWKFEEKLPNVPKNIHISDWFPQLSILSHPNCLVLITHGGLLSAVEALHVGVPIIGIPGFGDQFMNINRAEQKGYGLKVDLTYNVVRDLKIALEKIISNPLYRQKAKELSFIYHDRLAKPSEELSFWVRHVVETRGAPHLRSPARNLPFYQRFYLDLAAIVLVVSIVIVKILGFINVALYIQIKKIVRNIKLDNKKKQ